MRNMKFRVWNGNTFYYFNIGQMWSELIIDAYQKCCLNGMDFDKYTGLDDKNGKEIYEGDIIKTFYLHRNKIGIIKYCNQWGSFYFASKNRYGIGISVTDIFDWHYQETKDDYIIKSEVIGNIYENPELLEDE